MRSLEYKQEQIVIQEGNIVGQKVYLEKFFKGDLREIKVLHISGMEKYIDEFCDLLKAGIFPPHIYELGWDQVLHLTEPQIQSFVQFLRLVSGYCRNIRILKLDMLTQKVDYKHKDNLSVQLIRAVSKMSELTELTLFLF